MGLISIDFIREMNTMHRAYTRKYLQNHLYQNSKMPNIAHLVTVE